MKLISLGLTWKRMDEKVKGNKKINKETKQFRDIESKGKLIWEEWIESIRKGQTSAIGRYTQ